MADETNPPVPEASAPAPEAQTLVVASPEAPSDEPPLPPVADDMVVVAKSAQEMEVAQKSLVGWAERKIAGLEQELHEAQSNLDTAVKRKWATATFRRAVTIVQGRVAYYKRIKAALDAGYVIMPDLPGVTIAVRTSQSRPRQTVHESSHYGKTLPSATSDASTPGRGRYISPDIKYATWNNTSKDAQGRDKTTHMARARSFDPEFEFPIRFVKPQIFDETSKAMMLKVFDEIGIIGIGSPKPGQRLRATTLHGDPIVLGRVVRYEGVKRFTCAFLITWWLDTKTL